jgi:hypothetical protein
LSMAESMRAMTSSRSCNTERACAHSVEISKQGVRSAYTTVKYQLTSKVVRQILCHGRDLACFSGSVFFRNSCSLTCFNRCGPVSS